MNFMCLCRSLRKIVMSSSALKRKSEENGKASKSSGPPTKKPPAGHWSLGLKASMEDPELRLHADDMCVIIKDKYPKAKFHFLVLPNEAIPNMKSLKPEHIPLLKHLEEEGRKIAKKSSDVLDFRYGYHAIPSMSHIHLHVISQDFDSPCLKTKKHWNSFTTAYFIDSQDVIKMMEDNGRFEVDTSQYVDMLKRPLKCHVCKKDFNTIPALKQHLLGHIPDKAK